MRRLYPKLVNPYLIKYGVEMFRSPEDYYYFGFIDINNPSQWQDQIEPLWTYNLEGYTINRIISHVESFMPKSL